MARNWKMVQEYQRKVTQVMMQELLGLVTEVTRAYSTINTAMARQLTGRDTLDEAYHDITGVLAYLRGKLNNKEISATWVLDEADAYFEDDLFNIEQDRTTAVIVAREDAKRGVVYELKSGYYADSIRGARSWKTPEKAREWAEKHGLKVIDTIND